MKICFHTCRKLPILSEKNHSNNLTKDTLKVIYSNEVEEGESKDLDHADQEEQMVSQGNSKNHNIDQGIQEEDTQNYLLTRDMQRRVINAPYKFGYEDTLTFALYLAQGI